MGVRIARPFPLCPATHRMRQEVGDVRKMNTSIRACGNKQTMRNIGIALMAFGGLIILIAVPVEFWFSMLGAAMLAAGLALLIIS